MHGRPFLIRPPWQVVIPFCLFVLHGLFFGSWLVDDAGISFAYARNLAHGHGLVSQVGAEPVEGFSNPLWTFLLAPVFAADPVDPSVPVKVVSLLLVLGMFAAVGRIFHILLGPSFWARWACAGALTALALNTSVVAWTVSGLENPLYGLLAALYCLYCVRYATGGEPSGRTVILAGLSAAGLALTRPDGILFVMGFLLLAGSRALWRPAAWRPELRNMGLFLLVGVTPFLAYVGFRRAYFGDWLPNTYYAKEGPGLHALGGLSQLARNDLLRTHELLAGMFAGWAYVAAVLLVVGTVLIILRSPRRRRFAGIYVSILCAWAIFCLLPVDWMAEYRFATPFFVLCYILLFATMADVLATMRSAGPHVRRGLLLIGTAALLVQSTMIYAPRTQQFAAEPTARFQGVARMAASFEEYSDVLGITEASLLCPDVGGVLYYSRLKVYDLGGLCDRRIGRLLNRNPEGIRDYVLEEVRPTFIDLHDSWVLRTGFHGDPRFRQAYTPIWETPCELARLRRLPGGFYDGQYVRRDAVRSLVQLEQLRRRCGNGTAPLDVDDLPRGAPFPRGRQPFTVRMLSELTPSYMP